MTHPTYRAKTDNEGNWFPEGPGTGLGYYGGYLFPETRFESPELTERVVALMNTAFQQGILKQQQDIMKAIGLK